MRKIYFSGTVLPQGAPRYEGMDPDEKLVNLAVIIGQAKEFDESDDVQVLIDSRGGDVDEGLRIRDYLKNTFPNLHTKAIGKCYSIASVVLTAAKPENRTSSATADFMIHNPWGDLKIMGDATAMRKGAEDAIEYAKFLQATENKLAKMYQEDLGIDYSTLHKFMDREVYLTPKEAESINLVSSVDESRAFKAAAFATYDKQTMTKKSKMNKVMSAIEAFLTDTGAPVTAKALDTELEDGTFVRVETEAEAPAVGDMVYVVDQEGNEAPAPAGEHTLATGETISVDDSGTITAVAMGDDEEEAEASATVTELTEQLKAAEKAKEEAEARAEAAEAKTKEVQAKARALRKEIADMSVEPADEADLQEVGMRAAALASDKPSGHPFDKFAKMGAQLTGHVKKRSKFSV